MKKSVFLITLLAFLGFSFPSEGCDVCGCSLGGSYYGILPQFSRNFVGLRWTQSKFYAHMDHQSEYLQEEFSHDTYSKMELWGRVYISKKFQLFAFLPYSYNSMRGSEQTVYTQGIGDITLVANYQLINTGNSEENENAIKHTLIAGVGLKLPTGKFTLEDQGELVNPNFQLGTGSVDLLATAIYTLLYKKIGINVESGYKFNTKNKNDYWFGNQFHASGHFFYLQQIGNFRFLPNVGLLYEQGDQHKEGTVIQTNTGGNTTLLSTGVESYFKRFTLGVNYKHPLTQHFNTDEIADIQGKDRWAVSLSYNF